MPGDQTTPGPLRRALGAIARFFDRVLPPLERFVLFGPDPIDDRDDETPGPLETLLPWPVRVILVIGAWVVARIWYDSAPAQQIAWGLAYAGAIAVSLLASWWLVLLVTNAVLGGAWILVTRLPPPNPDRHPLLWRVQHLVEFANRQVSHIEVLWIWTAVLLSWKPQINYQLPAVAALYLLGPPLVNGLAQLQFRQRLSKAAGHLQWARRPIIYVATLLGVAILVLRTGDQQFRNLLPLALAVMVGLYLRYLRHRMRVRRVGETVDPDVLAFRRRQRELTRRADVGLGPVLVVGGLAALVVVSLQQRARLDARERAAMDGPPPPADACVPERGGPREAQVRMFLVADSQLHELGGERFPGQMELADALVPVALRPVELDVLSAATVWRFGEHWKRLEAEGSKPLFWAHLGDLGDLSCKNEVERATELLQVFPKAKLAGMALGNHDMSFTGNFFWSPFWTDACPSGPLEKSGSIALLAGFATAAIDGVGGLMAESAGSFPRSGALVSITPLGKVKQRGRDRGLAAVFVDTADGGAFDWGIAGMYGTFSSAQERKLRALVDELPAKAEKTYPGEGKVYDDPAWLVFAHHPMSEMTSDGRTRLFDFMAWLDARRAPAGPRTLALITAHTHRAQAHRHCVGGRAVRELNIGSTVDPPQEAALLEVGPDARDTLSVRLRTVPSVARAGLDCGGTRTTATPTLTAAACRGIVARLKTTPACEALFEPEDGLGRDCGELEKPLSLPQRIQAVANGHGHMDPAEIKREQNERVTKLLACVCRERDPGKTDAGADPRARQRYCEPPSPDVFQNEAYFPVVLERLRAGADSVDELACLAWAAAAVQEHKSAGMTFSEALRCAFDDTSLPAAQESIATLEARACH